MKIEKAFLKSKVAQRIAFLFVLCALLPIMALAVLSFNQVTKHLREQSLTRLGQTSKSLSMAIYERLLFLEADMIRVASNYRDNAPPSAEIFSPVNDENLQDRFNSLMVISDPETPAPLLESPSYGPVFTQKEKSLMLEGNTLLRTQAPINQKPRIFLSRAIDPHSDDHRFLSAEVNPFYLWYMGYETSLPAMTEFLVLDQNCRVLFSTLPLTSGLTEKISGKITGSSSGQFQWNENGTDYLARYREIFLQPKFQAPCWTMIASESKAYIHSPVAGFQKTFFLISLLSLWIVIFLSFNQIRRSLIPLEKLKTGVQRIAKKDFNTKVVITSRDEFADLARNFNAMAYRLGRQFKTLSTISEIDRAILSELKADDIVTSLLSRINDAFPCDAVGVTILNKQNPDQGIIYMGDCSSLGQTNKKFLTLSKKETMMLSNQKEHIFLEQAGLNQGYLAPLVRNGIKSFHIFPIFLQNKLAGIISFGYQKKPNLTEEDLAQARQLTDQVGVALSNARLIEELSDFSWSTLKALARAIDAKSPWTAGHSERVTNYALEIGREMGFSKEELDILKRGGLLHDIGKLGIPNVILDKTRRLTKKDKEILQRHPRLGARILEPISSYTEVMLIVLQHHENYDGTGYPEGLAGEEISVFSRVLAVADRFEAMTANRPYRRAIQVKDAIKFIRDNSGAQFDPEVVDAFLRLLEKEKIGLLATEKNLFPEYSTRSPK
jgi:putative nucleotidyltransferase with HDIG domain